jgi:predicted CXXCH cytochrome family protein
VETLLRQVRDGAQGDEYLDSQLSGTQVTIGSSAQCDVQLLGPGILPQHATLRASGASGAGGAQLSARRGARIGVRGKQVAGAALAVGDDITVGTHRLTLVAPPAGFDLALEIRVDPAIGASEFATAFRTSLDDTWLSRRRMAWVLFALVVVAGLALPLRFALAPKAIVGAPHWLPSDSLWSTGPLTAAHRQATGSNCRACHESVFVPVRDAACRICHQTTHDHVTAAQRVGTTLPPDSHCEACHREHDESFTSIVRRDDALCTNCHARSKELFGKLPTLPVAGFSKKTHPAFRATVWQPGPGEWNKALAPVATASEQSNLKFSHAQHLDADRVQRQRDGQKLACADCHVALRDGEHFAPVTMDKACSNCHELTFDPNAPKRQLPHGKPRDAILLIQDYYTRQAVNPERRLDEREKRRLPDRRDPEVVCTDSPVACAILRARTEVENQFSRRGCVSCHQVQDTGAAELADRFLVLPVRLTSDYFPTARFSHRAHAVQGEKTGDAACLTCHRADRSQQSTELLLPDIGRCTTCHGDLRTSADVPLGCGSCHGYHPESEELRVARSTAP